MCVTKDVSCFIQLMRSLTRHPRVPDPQKASRDIFYHRKTKSDLFATFILAGPTGIDHKLRSKEPVHHISWYTRVKANISFAHYPAQASPPSLFNGDWSFFVKGGTNRMYPRMATVECPLVPALDGLADPTTHSSNNFFFSSWHLLIHHLLVNRGVTMQECS